MLMKRTSWKSVGPAHSLGEGLFIDSQGCPSMVDINQGKIFNGQRLEREKDSDECTPTAITGLNDGKLEIVTSCGLAHWDLEEDQYRIHRRWDGLVHSEIDFRTNDAARSSTGRLIVGFMALAGGASDTGFVYVDEEAGGMTMISDDIIIPNSFIEIERNVFLISDSSKGTVYRYEFSENFSKFSRSVFMQYEPGVAPDGGCIHQGKIYIALWGGGAISVLSKAGVEECRLQVPVRFPTNVKASSQEGILWCASASEPDGGYTPNHYDGRLLRVKI